MFGPAGHLYVLLSATGSTAAPTWSPGPTATARRCSSAPSSRSPASTRCARVGGAVQDRDLANGPGKVCQAFGHRPRRLRPGPDRRSSPVAHRRRRQPARRRPADRADGSVSRKGVDTPWRFRVPRRDRASEPVDPVAVGMAGGDGLDRADPVAPTDDRQRRDVGFELSRRRPASRGRAPATRRTPRTDRARPPMRSSPAT